MNEQKRPNKNCPNCERLRAQNDQYREALTKVYKDIFWLQSNITMPGIAIAELGEIGDKAKQAIEAEGENEN